MIPNSKVREVTTHGIATLGEVAFGPGRLLGAWPKPSESAMAPKPTQITI